MNRPHIIILLWVSLFILLLSSGTGLAQSSASYRLTEATFDSGGLPAMAGAITIQGVLGSINPSPFSAAGGPLATGADTLDASPAAGESAFKLFLPVVTSQSQ